MKSKSSNWALVAVAAIAVLALAGEAMGESASGSAIQPVNEDVVRDLQKLRASNMAQISAAQTALSRTRSSEVKQLAGNIAADSARLEQRLIAFANERGIVLQGEDYKEDFNELRSKANEKLGDKRGLDFDKAYTELVISENKQLVEKNLPSWIKDANKAGEGEVAAIFESASGTLQNHGQLAQKALAIELNRGMGGAGNPGSPD